MGVQASAPLLGGRLTLGAAQPLVIEAGSARLTYGSGYDLPTRSLVYSVTDASLVGRRRVVFTAGYSRGWRRGSLRIGIGQHVGDGAIRALGGYTLGF